MVKRPKNCILVIFLPFECVSCVDQWEESRLTDETLVQTRKLTRLAIFTDRGFQFFDRRPVIKATKVLS